MTALLFVLLVLVILGNASRLPINTYPCGCGRREPVVFAMRRFCEEVVECLREPSWDEFSDSLMMLSELLRSVTFGLWRWVLPGGELSFLKGYGRYLSSGCPRSYRHICKKARWEIESDSARPDLERTLKIMIAILLVATFLFGAYDALKGFGENVVLTMGE